jgi:hypothetical protein
MPFSGHILLPMHTRTRALLPFTASALSSTARIHGRLWGGRPVAGSDPDRPALGQPDPSFGCSVRARLARGGGQTGPRACGSTPRGQAGAREAVHFRQGTASGSSLPEVNGLPFLAGLRAEPLTGAHGRSAGTGSKVPGPARPPWSSTQARDRSGAAAAVAVSSSDG